MSGTCVIRTLQYAARTGDDAAIRTAWDDIFDTLVYRRDFRGLAKAFCLCAPGGEAAMRDGLIRIRDADGDSMLLHYLVVASLSQPARIKMASLAHTVGFRFDLLMMAMLPSAMQRHVEMLRGFGDTAHTRIRERQLEPEPLAMFSRPAWEVFHGHDWSRFRGHRTILWRGVEALRLGR